MFDVFIGLGSNLGDSANTLLSAIDTLNQHQQIRVKRLSQFYQSMAIGPGEQPDYVNAAAHLVTSLPPEDLLDIMQAVENQHQRERGPVRWTARTLDLDLLLYADHEINSSRLKVPHPRINERNFVLLPLHDLQPSLVFPDGVCLIDLVKQTPRTGIAPLMAYPPIDYP